MSVLDARPTRTCVGCRAARPQTDLVRLAAHRGSVVVDRSRRLPGRGAYVCGRPCLDQAIRRRALPRALRQAVAIPSDLVESID
ncbi:YlxR family protein [Paraconexibacter sp.]|uniref:YlxR family protein n=1 Tax=Paraconexibacter sp. TaxID=2949640 RepID=UPI00356B5100